MPIKINPPEPGDVGPDALLVVNEASQEMRNWIESEVTNLRDQALKEVAALESEFKESINSAEQELKAASDNDRKEVSEAATAIVELAQKLIDPQKDVEALRQRVEQELEERSKKYMSIGGKIIEGGKKALGGLSGLSVLS